MGMELRLGQMAKNIKVIGTKVRCKVTVSSLWLRTNHTVVNSDLGCRGASVSENGVMGIITRVNMSEAIKKVQAHLSARFKDGSMMVGGSKEK